MIAVNPLDSASVLAAFGALGVLVMIFAESKGVIPLTQLDGGCDRGNRQTKSRSRQRDASKLKLLTAERVCGCLGAAQHRKHELLQHGQRLVRGGWWVVLRELGVRDESNGESA